MNIKYLVIPAEFSQIWDDMFTFAEMYGIRGNDFCGCRTLRASSGNMVVKFDV